MCPRCGREEHGTRVEALACIEVYGGRMARATASDRAVFRAAHDPIWTAAVAALYDRLAA